MKPLLLTVAGSIALGLAAAAAAVLPLPSAQAAASAPAVSSANPAAAAQPEPGRRGERRAARQNSPVFQTLRNLRELERLYLIHGRARDIAGLYRDVLDKTQHPVVRQFAYRRIARNELQPGDADKAIATLRQSLDENLRRLPAQ